ncbi:MAG: DUF1549 domain-containing protein, partial [bacterium]
MRTFPSASRPALVALVLVLIAGAAHAADSTIVDSPPAPLIRTPIVAPAPVAAPGARPAPVDTAQENRRRTAIEDYSLGRALEQQGAYSAAIVSYYNAAKKDGTLRGPSYRIGMLFKSRQQYRSAAQSFREELRRDPGSVPARMEYALALCELDDTTRARRMLRELVRTAPQDAEVWRSLGFVEGRMGDLATAFHRNTMTNDEGGTDNEEFRTAAVIDRVNTTWEGILGTTFACVQCHSHPYDPFRHQEYYQFMAFLNDTRDEDSYAEYPLLHEYKDVDSARFQTLKHWLATQTSSEEAARVVQFLRTRQPAINSLRADAFVNSELSDTKWLVMRRESSSRLARVDLTGRSKLLIRYESKRDDGTLTFRIDSLQGPVIARVSMPETSRGFQHHEVSLSQTNGVHDVYIQYQ